MTYLKIVILLTFCAFSIAAHSEPVTKANYHEVGDWKITDSFKTISKKEFFKNATKISKNEYNTTAKTTFAEKSNVKFIFKNGKLVTAITSLYDGKSEEDAINTLKKVIETFEKIYGGANFEGLSSSEGLKPDQVDAIIKQLKAKTDNFFKEQNEKDPNSKSTYNLYLQLWNEFPAKNNFLYVKFSYIGESDNFYIDLYEDKKLNTKHTYKTNIYIYSKK